MWRTRVLALHDVSDDDILRWRELAERAIEPNAYLDPRFLAPAARRPDAQDIRVVFAEYGHELRGVLQFSLGKLEDRWPVQVATTGGSFMSVHADRHHPLIAPEQPAETFQHLLRGIRSTGGAGLVLLRYLPADGPLAEAAAEAVDADRLAVLERVRHESAYAHSRAEAPGGEILDTSHMSTRSRKEYRRLVRVIERDAAGDLRVIDRAADPELVEDFLDFQAAGWKGDPAQGGGAFRLDPVHERWYREVVTGFSDDGDLVAPTLIAGGQTVFTALSLLSGGAAFGFIDAYNERFSRSSPGAIGRLAEWAYLSRKPEVSYFDPAFEPWQAASTKLYPDRREHADLLLGTTFGSRAVVRALPLARRMRDRLRPARAVTTG